MMIANADRKDQRMYWADVWSVSVALVDDDPDNHVLACIAEDIAMIEVQDIPRNGDIVPAKITSFQ